MPPAPPGIGAPSHYPVLLPLLGLHRGLEEGLGLDLSSQAPLGLWLRKWSPEEEGVKEKGVGINKERRPGGRHRVKVPRCSGPA